MPSTGEWEQKSFDFAADVCKQIITLSTAVTALTITFFKDFAQDAGGASRDLMAASWFCYFVSIVFGILTLMALTGSLGALQQPKITGSNVRVPAAVQIVLFAVGLLLTVTSGAAAL
jgi:hypothetical protein